MPRCHIYHKPTGTLLARDLYRHRYPWLMDGNDHHEYLPVGSFVIGYDDLWTRACGDPPGTLLLGRESLTPLPRGHWNGCCGPMGNHKNVLAPDEETPVAWEYADCHMSHCIRVQPEEHELEEVGSDHGICWVAWINYRGTRRLLRAAYGRDEAEVQKRLLPAATARRKQEAIGSQPGEVLNAEIELAPVEDFARSIGFDPYAHKAEVAWLARKYSTA